MIYGVYSMRDAKTGFINLSLDSNDEAAVRNFSHAIISTDGLFATYPQDFALLRLGSFDTDSGKLVLESVPIHLIDGAQVSRTARARGVSEDGDASV